MPIQSGLRMEGQQHANGHLQILDDPCKTEWAEVFGLMLGVPAMFAYGLPNGRVNNRRLIHKPRSVAQYEFTAGRGFQEHVALHHVFGAEMKHDQCFRLVTVLGLFRLSSKQAHYAFHTIQESFWFQLIVNALVEAADTTKLVFLFDRLAYVWCFLLVQGERKRSVAIVIGLVSSALAAAAYLLLPVTGGMKGVVLYLCGLIIKQNVGLFGLQAFFAQHVWNKHFDRMDVLKDWGRANAESTFSWWGANDKWWHPCLWGTGNGACPSTLSYHLEHTLFPALNYLYFPEIAPLVEETCKEFGVTYNKLVDLDNVLRARSVMLAKYSIPSTRSGTESLNTKVCSSYSPIVAVPDFLHLSFVDFAWHLITALISNGTAFSDSWIPCK